MRTTVAIDDNLLERAKDEARRRGTTLGTVIEDGLRELLSTPGPVDRPPVPVFRGGTGLAPGIEASTKGLIAALDEGLPIEKLR